MSNRISMASWIKEQVRDGINPDELNSIEGFQRFLTETGSNNGNFNSFLRRVREIKNGLGLTPQSEGKGWIAPSSPAVDEDEESYDPDILIALLNEETARLEKKLSTKEIENLAREAGVPVSAFFSMGSLPDLLEKAYKIANLDVKQDKEKLRLQAEIRSLREKYKKLAESGNTYDDLIQSVQDFAEEKLPISTPYPEIVIPKNPSESMFFHALFSDVHYGKVVTLDETLWNNKYDEDIAKLRIEEYFYRLIQLGQERGITRLHLSMLGDNIEGMIQEDSVRTANSDAMEQVIKITPLLERGITELTKYFEEIHISTKPGNHGRDHRGKPSVHFMPRTNYDNMVYQLLEQRLGSVVDSFSFEKTEYAIHRLFDDINFLEHHGHYMAKGGNGYQPVPNSIAKAVAKLETMVASSHLPAEMKKFAYVVMGHIHMIAETKTMNLKDAYTNGSIVGATEFSASVLQRADRPQQLVLVGREEEGIVGKEIININENFEVSE